MNDISEQRPDFFEGEILSASDLEQLVVYLRDQSARHALGAHTWGIVAGLQLLEQTSPSGALDVYRPADGARIASLPAGSGHWNSPIVADGRVALPEGDANEHAETGILSVYAPCFGTGCQCKFPLFAAAGSGRRSRLLNPAASPVS